ncbi:MAG: pseudouridine-5'-phosphate glycosidase [Acidobacteria bacterium]|nr:MAG: pseudouridine-5'-phosphate glycosidase [Acidobacteriota bacterium]REK04212.1 MAG: pseudouridine-5'-phosphate glycosidase [Acidobacteriota bacterium]REK15473.1 MAG: pseudouridine-5'-phosphate glycosidase [Acidobacteriota bacterium]REK46464.1 MAG: pseudouridine-5'-phosphate glycosidase [Acidobacteriota bacterium]
MREFIDVSDEVSSALDEGKPIVALESTVISHGLPSPDNLLTARSMIEAVRYSSAVPALIAVFNGRIKVGVDSEELERLNSTAVRKLSVRDLPCVVSSKLDGATTVATTSLFAYAAGIDVFATGGIGGIHKGGPNDVSADLPVLAETPISVVCSGAKAILDLPATREWLETHGVPVVGYGCNEFPAFYSAGSGLDVDDVVSVPEEAARIAAARDSLGLRQAVLFAVPVPNAEEINEADVSGWLKVAHRECEDLGITGRKVTPFLLSRVSELSEGRALKANIALLVNNARVAGKISVALKAATLSADSV